MIRGLCTLIFSALALTSQALADPYQDAFSAFSAANYPRALELVRPMAEKGDARAQSLLGVMYDFGNGVPKDRSRAVELYRKAAEQGFGEAEFYLAEKTQNPAEAAGWYLKAAEHGFVQAMGKLATRYESVGAGLPYDKAKATYWWRQAAEGGDTGAQWRLGLMYEQGIGVPVDLVQSLMWLDIAQGEAGPSHAIFEHPANPASTRRGLVLKMTPEQVADGDRRARTWMTAHNSAPPRP